MSNDYRERSKDRLKAEAKRLLKDLMVSCLDRAEKILNPNVNSPRWEQFRFEILNLGNDKQRQLTEAFSDYVVEFRPQIIFSVKYISENNKNIVDNSTICTFDFSFIKGETNLKITLPNNEHNFNILNEIADGIISGVIFEKDNKIIYEVWGLQSTIFNVIPFFDVNKPFKGKTLEKYLEWKEQVYKLEGQRIGVGNA